MNPDQGVSVNDPYEISSSVRTSWRSQYAKEGRRPSSSSSSSSSPRPRADKTIATTTHITSAAVMPGPPSTSIISPTEGRLRSKEHFTIHHPPQPPLPPAPSQCQGGGEEAFYSKNLFIASTLVVTYLIEVTVQILLLVQCCRSLQAADFIIPTGTDDGAAVDAFTGSWFLVISSVLSSLLVTLISIMWVFRGMDFSGRLCGRLLCYVMHSFLLGLLWRYLKLAFAYDRTDLEEFLKLKTIQTYIQSLPLVAIHLAWVLLMTHQFQLPELANSYHALSSWLVVAEMLSAVTSLLVLSTVSLTSTTSNSRAQPQETHKKVRVSSGGGEGDNNAQNQQCNEPTGTTTTTTTSTYLGDNHHHHQDGGAAGGLTSIKSAMRHYSANSLPGRGLLLISRLISLGMLVYEMNYWTGFITIFHLLLSLAWLTLWVRGCAPRRTCPGGRGGCDSESNAKSPVLPDNVQIMTQVSSTSHPPNVNNGDEKCDGGGGGGEFCVSNKCVGGGGGGGETTNPGNGRNVLARVLPLTYILFWDLFPPQSLCGPNRLNLWATALPVLLATAESASIIIFHWATQQHIVFTVAGGACLLLGWGLVLSFKFQKQRNNKLHHKKGGEGEGEPAAEYQADVESSDSKEKRSVNRKETGECLSLCCSSLSHPLNIKRKGHQSHRPSPDAHNFRNDKLSFEHDVTSPAAAPVTAVYNEYEEQRQGKLMNCQNGPGTHNSNSQSGRSRRVVGGVVKNPIMFPDLGITSDHTGVVVGGGGGASDRLNLRCRDNNVVACAKPTHPPVTNNYTNIKEALTRRISNKSCGSVVEKKRSYNHHHQDGESVKGDVSVQPGEPLSSLKSSSSSTTRQHLPQSTSNSNKCMPISIKSPISWLPETCCNDSSGSGGSSNSRNTNTLLPEPRFYCPENYIDLENNNEIERKEAEESGLLSRPPLPPYDFPIVFFDGRGTSRSHKQKQSRIPVGGGGAVVRTARSANATPVASSKHFALDIRPGLVTPENLHPYSHQHHRHHHHLHHLHPDHDHHHQYSYEDDPIESASRATRRNQITGKTYLSDGGSLTSLDGLCEIRASTPVEIKKASRVIVNYPPPHHQISDSKTVSRCLCTKPSSPTHKKCSAGTEPGTSSGNNNNNNNIYEKLIDDSYGILICEGETTQPPRQSGSGGGGGVGGSRKISSANPKSSAIVSENQHHHHPELSSSSRQRTGVQFPTQKLRILCAKCLQNHDPLLTNCVILQDDDEQHEGRPNSISRARKEKGLPQLISDSPFPYPPAESESTDYPSDTEFTTNNIVEDDGQSLSTHFSSATYTWHHQQPHHHYQPTQLSQFIWAASSMIPNSVSSNSASGPKEFTSLEYVRTWLMASHPRSFPVPHESVAAVSEGPARSAARNYRHYPSRADKALASPHHPFPSKSCDKTISKRKRFRQLEKRQRPVGRGASPPPPKEVCMTGNNNNSKSGGGGGESVAVATPMSTSTASAAAADATRFQPPPSRKQHPLLFYDMSPRQLKPLTATSHKKCRDQLDLFHKELETVV